MFHKPSLIKAVHLPSHIILCYEMFRRCSAPGEQRPQDWSFSRAICLLPSLPARSFLTSVEKGQMVSCRISIFWNSIPVPAFKWKNKKEGNWMWRLDLRHLPPGLLCSERLESMTEVAQQTSSWGIWQTNHHKTRPFSMWKWQNICNLTNSSNNSKKVSMLINAFCWRPTGISCIRPWFSFGHQALTDRIYFSVGPWPYIGFPSASLHMLVKNFSAIKLCK